MSKVASIARLRDGGTTWALGALKGDDTALERLGGALMQRWQPGDRLVVLGNMLGAAGNTPRTIDLMLLLRRRLLARPGAEVEDFVFLRGAAGGDLAQGRCSSSSPWRRSTCSTGCWRAGWTPSSRPMAIRSPRAASPAATGRSPSPAGPRACASARPPGPATAIS